MGDLFTQGAAVFSPCRLYRYRLTRRWGDGPTCAFIMLNPSTADEFQDDPTIRRCIGFARREGCGGLVIGNIFAFRAADPADMKAAPDPVGPENDRHLIQIMVETDGPAVAAWGAHGAFLDRAAHVRRLTDVPLLCLGLTKAGAPRHPLYIRGDAPLIEWEEARAALRQHEGGC